MSEDTESAKLREVVKKLTNECMKQGKIIEAGWNSFRLMAIRKDTSQETLKSMRDIFFAGAQHLFASILCSLDEGQNPTMEDLDRMDKIDAELRAYIAQLKEEQMQ